MRVIAYNSPFVPVEWIAAHGLRPHWLRPRGTEHSAVSAVRGVCPYAAAVLANCIGDDSAVVLTTACDQMRYTAALLALGGHADVFLFNMPSTWQTEAARKLYTDELRRLGRFLVRLGGKTPDDDRLAETMLAYDRARAALYDADEAMSSRRVSQAWIALHGPLPRDADLPPKSGEPPNASGIPLAVVGGPLLDADGVLFDLLERAGGRVAVDATEGGRRTMPRPFDLTRLAADPFQELADAYFAIPDAFRRPNRPLYEWLANELAAHKVQAIVVRRYVWCDLWHAELQRLKQWSRLPSLELDVGLDDMTEPNRLQGRIEAFLEMLR